MPSLVVTGKPCAGKTKFAALLASRALRHPSGAVSRVAHIHERTARPDATKSECYLNSDAEKVTRAALKSEFDRAVVSDSSHNVNDGGKIIKGGSSLVILDSLNYIKGYRYELYCISKAAGARHGVVWIMGGDDDLAKRRNRERKELQLHQAHQTNRGEVDTENNLEGYYQDDGTVESLVLRYEPPDSRNRWENPLYRVDMMNVFSWGKDGTLQDCSESKNPVPGNEEVATKQMKAMKVKDTVDSPNTSVKPVKRSSAGFKRRSKKYTQQASLRQPQLRTPAPSNIPPSVPSSIASRNLKHNEPEQNSGNKQKIEDVIDGILDSFLTDIAPLTEGKSTMNQTSAESDSLNQVDSITQRINGEILKAQRASGLSAGVGGRILVPLSGRGAGTSGGVGRCAMDLPRSLYANDLRNCRRQFLKWIAAHPVPDGTAEEKTAEGYISYIESNI